VPSDLEVPGGLKLPSPGSLAWVDYGPVEKALQWTASPLKRKRKSPGNFL